MSWIVGRCCQMAGCAVPTTTMWVSNFHPHGRCFVFLDRMFVRNFVLQGLRSSEGGSSSTVSAAAAAPALVEKKKPARVWKKKRRSQEKQEQDGLQSVVVVELASKAKTIAKYLGPSFTVLPSHGHVRDLASRAGSVRPEDDFNMLWEVPGSARPHINSIKAALKRFPS